MRILNTLCLGCLFSALAYSQSDEIYTEAYFNDTNGHGYAGPFSDVVAANLNTQLFPFQSSDSTLSFHIGVIAARSVIPESMKTHMGTSIGLNPEQTVEVPTIFGSNESVLVEDTEGNIHLFPGGFALRQMTFLVPQVSISGLMNTDVSVRFFTISFGDGFEEDIEDLTFLGVAARHHIDSYLGLPENIDLALGYAYNNIDVDAGTIKNVSHFGFAEVGLQGAGWRVFAHGGYVSSMLEIDYQDSETTILFDTEGTSNIRFGIGGSYSISIINIGAQLDMSEPLTYSGYVGLQF